MLKAGGERGVRKVLGQSTLGDKSWGKCRKAARETTTVLLNCHQVRFDRKFSLAISALPAPTIPKPIFNHCLKSTCDKLFTSYAGIQALILNVQPQHDDDPAPPNTLIAAPLFREFRLVDTPRP
ncbi:hypothetical protein AXG93_2265s1160 [Marchantia polymorpha subsp. ruderalis]|uniref:Uncharacterized protein n=1 Tax=Marchantia polymorpha subsp. ruderalis TaxID=1480154 RepID=A0A176WC96_MARPO|nr:hypothetical protein AXG93_2265s1160 [Marchantia polymorpha subsp. ruderalis]